MAEEVCYEAFISCFTSEIHTSALYEVHIILIQCSPQYLSLLPSFILTLQRAACSLTSIISHNRPNTSPFIDMRYILSTFGMDIEELSIKMGLVVEEMVGSNSLVCYESVLEKPVANLENCYKDRFDRLYKELITTLED